MFLGGKDLQKENALSLKWAFQVLPWERSVPFRYTMTSLRALK